MTRFARYADMREGILHPRKGFSRSTWPFGMPLSEQRRTVLNLIDALIQFEKLHEECVRMHADASPDS